MMARVLDRTPMRDPGGGKVNLEAEKQMARVRDALKSGREKKRRREDSLDRGGGEGVVRLGLGLLLDELGKVSLVVSELLGLVVDLKRGKKTKSARRRRVRPSRSRGKRTHDVGANVVQESRVVRDNEAGDLGLGDEVPLEPSNGTNI